MELLEINGMHDKRSGGGMEGGWRISHSYIVVTTREKTYIILNFPLDPLNKTETEKRKKKHKKVTKKKKKKTPP